MTITDREAPGTVTREDQLLAELAGRVERMEALWVDLLDTLGVRPAAGVNLGDPLAPFRTPAGTVAYVTVPVGALRAGDWFQRRHGDPDWHHVRPLIFAGDQVGVPFDDTGLEWFARGATVRVARPAAEVVDRQEQREAGR